MYKSCLIPAAAQRRSDNFAGTAAGVDELIVTHVDADMIDITVSAAGEAYKITDLEL